MTERKAELGTHWTAGNGETYKVVEEKDGIVKLEPLPSYLLMPASDVEKHWKYED